TTKSTLSLHDALPIYLSHAEEGGRAFAFFAWLPLFFSAPFVLYLARLHQPPSSVQTPNSRCLHVQNENPLGPCPGSGDLCQDKRSEEHTSELQSRFDL